MVTDYYVQRGWDPDSGAPLPGTLEALDIAEYAGFAGHAVVASATGPVLPPIVAAVASAPVEQHQEYVYGSVVMYPAQENGTRWASAPL